MHDLAINKEHHDTTACCSSLPKQRVLALVEDWLAYIDSGPRETKLIYSTFPCPDLANDMYYPPNAGVIRYAHMVVSNAYTQIVWCRLTGTTRPEPEPEPELYGMTRALMLSLLKALG